MRLPRTGRAMQTLNAWCAWSLLLLASCDERSATPGTRDGGADSGTDSGTAGQAATGLLDDSAGIACARDHECVGGRCEHPASEVPGTTANLGYCTSTCTSNGQCGRGGLCVASTDAAEDHCLAACEQPADCRDGFLCVGAVRLATLAALGTCRPMQSTGTLGDDVAGSACEGDADCEGGLCASANPLGTRYPDNYCTGRCYDDAACGRGGVCLLTLGSRDPGHCLQHCDGNADCGRDGYRCWELGTGERLLHACFPGARALPDHTTGKACDDDSICGGGTCADDLPRGTSFDNEFTSAPGGYCTEECMLDLDCGAGAQCVSRGPRGGLCLASCSEAMPCREGYQCSAHFRDGDPEAKVCTPKVAAVAELDAGI